MAKSKSKRPKIPSWDSWDSTCYECKKGQLALREEYIIEEVINGIKIRIKAKDALVCDSCGETAISLYDEMKYQDLVERAERFDKLPKSV
jgi:YgiT-type zinc finger domain-containing protein